MIRSTLMALVLSVASPVMAGPDVGDTPVDPYAPTGDPIAAAAEALEAGDYDVAARTAGAIADDLSQSEQDRAEAWRIVGLSRFFLGERQRAEAAFLAYLRIDLDAHLDPALVAPEAIVFFEDVRARHAAELDALRPPAEETRSLWINFLPAGGQFQNGETGKAWILLGGVTVFAATNLTTYALARRNCDEQMKTCDDPDTARALKAVNIISGAAAIGLYAYSVIDGYRGYRAHQREQEARIRIGLTGGDQSVGLVIGGDF